MKTIIAGSRTCLDYALLCDTVIKSRFEITEVVSGKAPGADTLGEQWAVNNSIPIKEFPANWKKFGNKAGPLRNQEMADYAEALLALWDGKSHGTSDMIDRAIKRHLRVYIKNYGDYSSDVFDFL